MLTIITNTFNHKETTVKYLPKMVDNCGVECELLINDNCSTDGLAEWLKDANSNIIYNKENIGVPKGLNQLLTTYHINEYVAKIDPDFIMPDNWAKQAIELLKDNPDIGIVGFYWGRGLAHPDLQKGDVVKVNNNIIFVPNKVFGVWVFKRELLEKVGLFWDEVMYGNWDTEFNERVKRNGLKCVYHRFDSIHMGADTLNERLDKNLKREGVVIPELITYKADEFREAVNRTDR